MENQQNKYERVEVQNTKFTTNVKLITGVCYKTLIYINRVQVTVDFKTTI